MAGTLTISTLSDGTNSTSSTNCIQGSAKAWVNFQGTATPTINASYNVSSVTYVSTGTWTIAMTTALADNKYVVVGGYSFQTGYTSSATIAQNGNYSNTSTTFQIYNLSYTSAATNATGPLYVAVFR